MSAQDHRQPEGGIIVSKEIPLSQGKVALVDDEDFERINRHKWFAHKKTTGKFYAVRNIGQIPHRRLTSMHREVMNAPQGLEVDHVHSDDTLDNRKANLRLATHSQNKCNVKRRADNKSGYKGVSWSKQKNKWQAHIESKGKQINLGLFTNLVDAAIAYDKAAKELHGEFASLNFPLS